jgi:outer membrane lipoprotein-sorting protein
MRRIRITVAVILLSLLAAGSAAAISGKAVMENVEDRDRGDSMHALVYMDLVESDGDVKERIIENWTMDNESDLLRTVIVFHRPASVQGTRFLVKENENRDDDQWIYLPALKRVRRIASGEGDQAFMGTDYTYDDLKSRDVSEDRHTLLREERYNGRDCYVVRSVPKEPGDSQYSKRVQWVAKDIWIPLKAELYDKDGDLKKVQTVHELKQVQGYWTPMKATMENVQSGHATKLDIDKIRYNEDLDPDLFSTRYLRTGRVQ